MVFGWLGSLVVRVLDLQVQFLATALLSNNVVGKLFTPTCLCRLQ